MNDLAARRLERAARRCTDGAEPYDHIVGGHYSTYDQIHAALCRRGWRIDPVEVTGYGVGWHQPRHMPLAGSVLVAWVKYYDWGAGGARLFCEAAQLGYGHRHGRWRWPEMRGLAGGLAIG